MNQFQIQVSCSSGGQSGGGYFGPYHVTQGQTVGQVFNQLVPGGAWASYTVLKNGQRATTNDALYAGDNLTISQANVKGA